MQKLLASATNTVAAMGMLYKCCVVGLLGALAEGRILLSAGSMSFNQQVSVTLIRLPGKCMFACTVSCPYVSFPL